MKRREVTEPVFGTKLLFLFGGKQSEAAKSAQKWMQECGTNPGTFKSEEDCDGYSFTSGLGHYCIWIEDHSDTGTLAHEASHIAIWMMERFSTPINDQTSEPFARYVGWIVREGSQKP